MMTLVLLWGVAGCITSSVLLARRERWFLAVVLGVMALRLTAALIMGVLR